MAAGKYNILIEQGSDFRLPILIRDKTTLDPRDLTGYTVSGAIRVSFDDTAPVASFVISGQDLPNGEFTIGLTNATTTTFTFETAYYNVEITSPGGIKERVMEGRAVLSRDAS